MAALIYISILIEEANLQSGCVNRQVLRDRREFFIRTIDSRSVASAGRGTGPGQNALARALRQNFLVT